MLRTAARLYGDLGCPLPQPTDELTEQTEACQRLLRPLAAAKPLTNDLSGYHSVTTKRCSHLAPLPSVPLCSAEGRRQPGRDQCRRGARRTRTAAMASPCRFRDVLHKAPWLIAIQIRVLFANIWIVIMEKALYYFKFVHTVPYLVHPLFARDPFVASSALPAARPPVAQVLSQPTCRRASSCIQVHRRILCCTAPS